MSRGSILLGILLLFSSLTAFAGGIEYYSAHDLSFNREEGLYPMVCSSASSASRQRLLRDISPCFQSGDEFAKLKELAKNSTGDFAACSGHERECLHDEWWLNDETAKIKKLHSFRECGLTDLEIIALIGYTASTFQAIQDSLRPGAPSKQAFRPEVDTLISALSKLGDFHGTVYRDTTIPADEKKALLTTGYLDVGYFTSTTLDSSHNLDFGGKDRLIIQSKTGKYVAIFGDPDEQEILFAPGLRLHFLHKRLLPNGRMEWTLEEVDPQ